MSATFDNNTFDQSASVGIDLVKRPGVLEEMSKHLDALRVEIDRLEGRAAGFMAFNTEVSDDNHPEETLPQGRDQIRTLNRLVVRLSGIVDRIEA